MSIVFDHHLVSAVPIVYEEGLRLHPRVPCLGSVQHEGNVVEVVVLGHAVKLMNGFTISDLNEEGLEYNSWHLYHYIPMYFSRNVTKKYCCKSKV